MIFCGEVGRRKRRGVGLVGIIFANRKKTGGLGIKKLELFNSSLLLCKWKWFFCEIFFCMEKAWRDLKNLQFGGEIYGA
jgi:hypothetical protein